MSFSITVAGNTKGEAKARAASQLNLAVQDQRAHDGDRHLIQDAIEGAVDALGEPAADERVTVSAHGSVMQAWFAGGPGRVMGCDFTVKVRVEKV